MKCAGCGQEWPAALCWECLRKLPQQTRDAYAKGTATLNVVLHCLKIRPMPCTAFGGGRRR